MLVNVAAAEVDLAAWDGDAAMAVRVATDAVQRLAEIWPVDRLAALRLLATAMLAAADAAAAAREVGDATAADGWVTAGEPVTRQAEQAVADFTACGARMGPEALAWQARLVSERERLRGTASPELDRAAVDAFTVLGHVYEEARARWRLAASLLAVDRREEAAQELRTAHEVAVRLGAAPLRSAVEALARRARLAAELPGAARPVDPSAVFTPRETEVLALMAKGRTNKQIGGALYISEKTASVHVSNLVAKLGASGRTEAVAIAAQRGLLP
jgi:DNA-binding CsgD family transcriptional regulator